MIRAQELRGLRLPVPRCLPRVVGEPFRDLRIRGLATRPHGGGEGSVDRFRVGGLVVGEIYVEGALLVLTQRKATTDRGEEEGLPVVDADRMVLA